jgi:hypothetical protein
MKLALKQDLHTDAWGTRITLPKGTEILEVKGTGGGFAVKDTALLVELTGNSHDPIYRYLWVAPADVEQVP